MQEIINQKLQELAELASLSKDNNTAIIIYALLGAKAMQHDGLLATRVQEVLKKELMPKIKEAQASLN